MSRSDRQRVLGPLLQYNAIGVAFATIAGIGLDLSSRVGGGAEQRVPDQAMNTLRSSTDERQGGRPAQREGRLQDPQLPAIVAAGTTALVESSAPETKEIKV